MERIGTALSRDSEAKDGDISAKLERNYSYSSASSRDSIIKEKSAIDTVVSEDEPAAERNEKEVAPDMENIALQALHVDDDPTLNPWTFRTFFIGLGLSAFGSALATIFMFKPQSVSVSIIFLTVVSYVGGHAMAFLIPQRGALGRWMNPHPFNAKEHLAIVIMSSSASDSARATEVLAAQKLYYNVVPNTVVAILLLFSSQLLGYGVAGILRRSLVYPTKMVWPGILPLSSLIEALHRDRSEMQKKFKFFWIVFAAVAVWEIFPQYIMPVLVGVSVFCLANQNSLVFTNIFGGAAGNEGLGLLSMSFDWNYIGSGMFFLPPQTLINQFIGYVGCVILFVAIYYTNHWRAFDFPFLSQQLFAEDSTSTAFKVYNQSLILNANNELDEAALQRQGLPFFAATYAVSLLSSNLGITAAITHIALYNRDTLRKAFDFDYQWWLNLVKNPRQNYKAKSAGTTNDETDPHYRAMLAYKEVPNWWYSVILVASIITGMGCSYNLGSTLPWWGFVIALVLSSLGTLFFGALAGLLGFGVPITSVIQLVGGYIHPGKPVANMYFVLFGANVQSQALGLVSSLKLGQYGKLSPRCTFTMQIIGTVLGAVINYALMATITTAQRDILLSTQGTNIWSGQAIQAFNSNAIAFGALSSQLFSLGRLYSWVVLALPLGLAVPLPFYALHRLFPKGGWNYLVTPLLCFFLGYLSVGINSSVGIYFVLGFFVQFWVRVRYPRWFIKYNYVLAAAISGGTEMLVFLTTFTVQGGAGPPVEFPPYFGNAFYTTNLDYCMVDPALGG